ncbi:MAG: multifunctional oxoglutarate decarboxylase/oxoglutarate dehydrogenase thiamine pyrophosphate-binding subunit/dihydrolipoyllysine-residue succinyltransferase subunit [Micrococcaceae bacterium]
MTSDSTFSPDDFGANDWLVDELYEQYKKDPNSVNEEWREIFEKNPPTEKPSETETTTETKPSVTSKPIEAKETKNSKAETSENKVSNKPTKTKQKSTKATPKTTQRPKHAKEKTMPEKPIFPEETKNEALKGMSKAIANNMDASLSVPTATTVRAVPAKLLIDNRIVINNHLKRTRGGKISFTHLIGYAVVKAVKALPGMNISYDVIAGKPTQVIHDHVNFGLAIDLPRPDGSRALVVPNIKGAEKLDFQEFREAYDEIIVKARNNKLTAADYAKTTISLTNPGGIGTVHSVPRLSKGQACIVGVGALEYPAAFQGASDDILAKNAISKIITLTSTYDHRVIQGAASGEFLKLVHGYLLGQDDFYNEIFRALEIPYKAIEWSQDNQVDPRDGIGKVARIQEMINTFRQRGHMMAAISPIGYKQRDHKDLDTTSYGLTLWDLDREWPVSGLSDKKTLKLRTILGILRDAYCRTIGTEYMHISDPEQRQWFQEKLERPYEKPSSNQQRRILSKLNEAEAFETFLQTKYVGQKRFSLEGGESLIPLLDEVLHQAAKNDLPEVAIGMAHRGRLNVLTNIAGKTYSQVFREFEGHMKNPKNAHGSGDVKYHLGTEGTYTGDDGQQTDVYLPANPSHLEAVNPVLEGIVRAKQDKLAEEGAEDIYGVLPILVHGDAAMAGQGVVAETLQLSQLEGYKTGGTIHVVVNNQVGFTTRPEDGRSSMYCTDIAKMVDAPIFHVNGDDPEAVVHVAQLAFEYRQRFNRDIVIDMVCYRRRGHNEGDDPSMTQPSMYAEIDKRDSVRNLYTRDLIGREDITEEEAEEALADFKRKLETAFESTRGVETDEIPIVSEDDPKEVINKPVHIEKTAVSKDVLEKIGNAHINIPEGFEVHPKLKALLERRAKMSKEGGIDWGFGEILAFGSLLLEDKYIRLAGQDSRRGTFVQRQAVYYDRHTDEQWIPLNTLGGEQAKFDVYNSLLSEYAGLGFEYGYSVEKEDGLIIWEAQFGDFANGAQTIMDEFISSAEQKWGQKSNIVMLLPHGYEGQGPDHSSGRIERYLQLCAENNMQVVFPSSPASYFHALRNHAYKESAKPMIVFSPKSMLRLKAAASRVEDFTDSSFRPVIPETHSVENVKRVLLCAGKIYYDLLAARKKSGDTSTAIIRCEQLYPVPNKEIQSELDKYPDAEVFWVQEEPENQGAWASMLYRLAPVLDRKLGVYARAASASTAAGSIKVHAKEQQKLLKQIFGEK